MSLDEQCYKEFGTKSCFSDSRVCTQLACLNPATGGCISYRPAVEGSQCGDGKVCKDGQCTQSPDLTKHNQIKKFKKVSVSKETTKPKKKNNLAKPENSIPKKRNDNKSINVRGVS